MANSYVGIFVASSNQKIKESIQDLWDTILIKDIHIPFKGFGVYNLKFKYPDPSNFNEYRLDNKTLNQNLLKISLLYPNEIFVLIEKYEHGDTTSYQGVVYQNGVCLLEEMGDFDFVFKNFQKEFEENKLDWYIYYDNRLKSLLNYLGLNKEDCNLFDFLCD